MHTQIKANLISSLRRAKFRDDNIIIMEDTDDAIEPSNGQKLVGFLRVRKSLDQLKRVCLADSLKIY